MTMSTQNQGPDLLPAYQPEALARPTWVYPAAPRIIYRTARADLSHQGRIKRIDQAETLAAFRAFSDTFHARDTLKDPELRACLHNHGFFPDKGALYGLPNDALDDYLSDFQTALLPMANGHCAVALRDRRLFWQLYRNLLPLAPMAGMVLGGRLLRMAPTDNTGADGPVLARALSGDTPAPCVYPTLADLPLDQGDLVVFDWSAPEIASADVIRLAFIHDHQAETMAVLAAVLLNGAPVQVDHPHAQTVSAPIDVVSGIVGHARSFCRNTGQHAPGEGKPPFVLTQWTRLISDLTAGLMRLPIGVVVQLDLLLTPAGPLVVDATDRLDVAAYQVHGPMMARPMAKAFLREFGL